MFQQYVTNFFLIFYYHMVKVEISGPARLSIEIRAYSHMCTFPSSATIVISICRALR